MEIKRYVKKPIPVEAMRYTGDNGLEIGEWIGDSFMGEHGDGKGPVFNLRTKMGNQSARVGDYILAGVDGEFYPCPGDTFEKTYEEVES